ncbi:MAG: sugar MFS transporter [Opitutales bacterium]|nr:sugar MFS transporter [Opitutales bacterium]
MLNSNSRVVPGVFLVPFVMLVSCFMLWGLLNNMTDNLVPAFQKIFTMDQSKAGLVQVAFYGAYAVLAIFASILIEEFSYRVGVLIGLGIYIVGALLYIPACIHQSFNIYFIAIFVVASGCSLLETTCNPYVLAMGDKGTAVRRLNFAQMFNPVGSMLGIVLAQQLILANLNPATADERALMPAEQLSEIVHHELFWVCAPYVGLCAVALGIWLFFLFNKSAADAEKIADAPAESSGGVPAESAVPVAGKGLQRVAVAALFSLIPLTALYFAFPEMNKVVWILLGMLGPVAYLLVTSSYREILFSLLKKPRYWFGVVAQFFYVGVQIAAWTWLNVYCQKEMGVTAAEAATYYTISIVLFISCRWVATFLMKYFNPATMMSVFAVAAIAACFGVMYLPAETLFEVGGVRFAPNVLCLIAMSGCMSLMFPTIYGIALGGLDKKEVKLGASGLIIAILGGAIITPWMSDIIGSTDSLWLSLTNGIFDGTWDSNLKTSSAAVRAAFVVPAICFAVVLAYALIFRKTEKAVTK